MSFKFGYIHVNRQGNILDFIISHYKYNTRATPGRSQLVNDKRSPILSLLFNRCINEGLFPDEFKNAKIKPLYKSGSKNDMLNFRPISILPQISKYFEKIIKFRLVYFLNKYSIIDKSQYGFRKNMSTGDALADVIETINDNL